MTHSKATAGVPTVDIVSKPAPGPSIAGIGISAPQHGVCYQDGSEMAKRLSCDHPSQHRTVEALYRRTKIANRGSVLLDEKLGEGEFQNFYPAVGDTDDCGPSTKVRADRYTAEAPRLALPAATAALADANCSAASVTHLVTVSCTGFTAPGVDVALIKSLGLPLTTQRIAVGFMGCHGSINGLRSAAAIAASDPNAVVLMVSVELCSLHYQYGFDPDRIVSGALFSDGSAALVVRQSSVDEVIDETLATDSDDQRPLDPEIMNRGIVGTGSLLVPDSEAEMTWKIGNHGYQMTLSSKVPMLIEGHLRSYLSEFLAGHGESIETIGGWAVHPGGPRILDAVQTGLSLPASALATSRAVLREHGNMSSATMLFILRRFKETSVPGPWLMLGFGPGLEIETALIR